jgi:hypothetical protein
VRVRVTVGVGVHDGLGVGPTTVGVKVGSINRVGSGVSGGVFAPFVRALATTTQQTTTVSANTAAVTRL